MALTVIKSTGIDTTGNYTVNGINVSANANVANLTANGVINFTGTSNVSLGAVGNVKITGGTTGQYLQTDGSGNLSFVTLSVSTSSISNGNSNVSIPSANGNVTISAVGNANIVIVTGTGVNVSGTLNATGNANVGNIGATGGYFTTVAGSLTTASQPNITSVGTLSSLTVTGNITSGNANLGNLVTANFFSGSGNLLSNIQAGNISGTIANANYATYAGTVITASQPNITSVGTLTGLTTTGTANFIGASNVSLGNISNIKITGGSANYVIQTDGAGNLSWVATSSGTPGGSNTQLQFNDNGSFGGNAGLIFDKTTTTLTANNFIATTTANLGAVGNVKITGGSANYILKTDGSGNLSWTQQPQGANVVVDNFTGNGVQTVFTLSTTPANINCTIVNYNGVTLLRSGYSLSGANLTFSPAPANGSYIEVTTLGLTTSSGGGGGTSAAAAVGFSLVFGA